MPTEAKDKKASPPRRVKYELTGHITLTDEVPMSKALEILEQTDEELKALGDCELVLSVPQKTKVH